MMKTKLVLSTLTGMMASAFTVSSVYAADAAQHSANALSAPAAQTSAVQPLTQEQLQAVLDQIDALKTQVGQLEGQLKQQNSQLKSQEQKIKQQNRDIQIQKVQLDEQKQESRSVENDKDNLGKMTKKVGDMFSGVRRVGLGTGHEFGLDSDTDGTSLLIQAPQLNKDYNLLLTNDFLSKKLGDVSQTGPRVQISGTVEAYMLANSNPFGQYIDDVGNNVPEKKSDLLGQAEFDMAAEINDWWTGYMHFYSDTEPGTNVEMEQAFLVLGNLDEIPTYASAGLMFLSNGYFYTNMVSRPLTREIGRTRDNVAQIGTTWNGFRATLFGYDSERQLEHKSSDSLDQWGFSGEFNRKINQDLKILFGIGYVNDSSGAEAVAASNVFPIEEDIERYIPAGNVHAKVTYQDFIFYAEYQDNFRAFTADEISFNGEGAKLSAGNFEITYNFDFGRPSWVTANYGFTTEALALQLPKSVWGLTYGVEVLKNTILSFEYLYQKDYDANDVGTTAVTSAIYGQNDANHQFTAQVDIYF